MICFFAESSGHHAVAARSLRLMSPPVWGHIKSCFSFECYPFKVPCSVRGSTLCLGISHPEHVALMPCSSWPRKEFRYSTSITLGHCIRRLFVPLIMPTELIVVATSPLRNRQASHMYHSLHQDELYAGSRHTFLIVFPPIGID